MALDAELDVHRAVTDAWIDSDPVAIVLTRQDRVRTPAGGWTNTDRTLEPQTFRIDRGTNASIQYVTTPEGTNVPERFRLVGEPTADVQEGDDFTFNGGHYQVTKVHRQTFQRTAAEVEYLGQ